MSPPPDRPAGSPPRPPSKGPAPKGPQNPASGPHRPPATPSLGGKRPAGAGPPPPKGPAPKGPAPKGPPPKGAAPPQGSSGQKGTGRPAQGRPPVQAPAPKAFEIRRGRADKEGGVDVEEDGERPLGPVVLPRSITQEAEEESLKGRFGVEKLPEVGQRNTLVTVADSAGQSGPERTAGGKLRLVLVLVVVVAVVAVALKAMKIIP